MKAARMIRKDGRVESLVRGNLDGVQLLTTKVPEVKAERERKVLAEAIEEVSLLDGPLLPRRL